MKKYDVFVTDRPTRIPLIKVEAIAARSKRHAAWIVKENLTHCDNSYVVTAKRSVSNG